MSMLELSRNITLSIVVAPNLANFEDALILDSLRVTNVSHTLANP